MYYTDMKYGRKRRKEYPFVCVETDTGPAPHLTTMEPTPTRAVRHQDVPSSTSSDVSSTVESAVLTAISSCISSGD